MVTACACNQKRYHTRPCAAASQPPTPVRMAHAAHGCPRPACWLPHARRHSGAVAARRYK